MYSSNASKADILSVKEAELFCRKLTLSHYENFITVSFLLPKELHKPFYAVYAYCRISDDIGDEHNSTDAAKQEALRRFDVWERHLDECFDLSKDVPNEPVFIALRQVIRPFALVKEPFADLLKAFRHDQIQSRYETLEELLGYCRYSANPVGRIVLRLFLSSEKPFQEPAEEQYVWSDSICTGLQLANFWQDIQRDALMGRCYIPQEFAAKHNVSIEELMSGLREKLPQLETLQFRSMLRELTEDARCRLNTGQPLAGSLPKQLAKNISLFIGGGLAILNAVEKCNYNVLTKRPVVSKWTQLCLLVRACF
ncbi:squalene synthase HpnC [Planctomycetales bacterium]|nr:squalene synthase HpnC [Planctomycetales bacterium]